MNTVPKITPAWANEDLIDSVTLRLEQIGGSVDVLFACLTEHDYMKGPAAMVAGLSDDLEDLREFVHEHHTLRDTKVPS